MTPAVKNIRQILDNLALSESSSNDEKEIILDREISRFNSLDYPDKFGALTEAVGTSTKRRKASGYLFAELHDHPAAIDVFRDLLSSPDSDVRSAIIQNIGRRNITGLAKVLTAHVYNESDSFCRDAALFTLGKMALPCSHFLFVQLAAENNPKDHLRVIQAAIHYQRREFTEFSNQLFETGDVSLKVLAAWSLGKMGSRDHFKYLVAMLNDPEIFTPTSYDPGNSLRAAQAIADIKGWEFEWRKSSVAKVKERLKSSM